MRWVEDKSRRGIAKKSQLKVSTSSLALGALTAAVLGSSTVAAADTVSFTDPATFQAELQGVLSGGRGASTLTYLGAPDKLSLNGTHVSSGSNSSLGIHLGRGSLHVGYGLDGALTLDSRSLLTLGSTTDSVSIKLGSDGHAGSLIVDGGAVEFDGYATDAIEIGYGKGFSGRLEVINGGVIDFRTGSTDPVADAVGHDQIFVGWDGKNSWDGITDPDAGTGTLILDQGSIILGERGASMRFGIGGTAEVILRNGSVIDSSLYGSHFWVGERGSGSATVSLYDTSRLVIKGDGGGERQFIVGRNGGTGVFNQYGDSYVHVSGTDRTGIGHGDGADGTYNLYGGTLEVGTETGRDKFRLGLTFGNQTYNTTATFNVEGGSAYLWGDLEIANVGATNTGIVNVRSGLLDIDGQIVFGDGTAVVNLEGGVLAMKGSNATTGTGALNFDGGTLRAKEDLTVQHAAAILAGGAIFDSNGHALTYTGQLDGAGGITKIGSGDLSVSTLADTMSGLRIEAGDVLVGSNLLLAGSDTQTELEIGAASKLKVSGNFSLDDGDSLTTGLNADGGAGWVEVTGNADLEGILSFDAKSGYRVDHAYTIVTAASFTQSAAADNFSFANNNFAFVTPELTYADETTLQLKLAANGTQFVDVASSDNQSAAAAGLQSVGNGELFSAVQLLSEEEAQTAFDNISGETHATSGATVLNESQSARGVVHTRLQHAGKSRAPTVSHVSGYAEVERRSSAPFPGMAVVPEIDRNTFWTQGYGSWGHTKGDGNSAGVDRSGGGVMIGYDRGFGQDWLLGVAAGYSRSDFDVDDRSSSGKADSYNLLVYASGDVGQVKLRVGAGYSWNNIDSTRNVILSGFAEQVTASYSSGATQLFGEISHGVSVSSSTTLTPFAGLAHVHVSTDDYSEEGGSSALAVAGATDNVSYGSLGLRAEHSVLVGATTVTLQGSAAWQHAWGDLAPVRTVSFAGGDSFLTTGAPIARDAALLQAGFDVDVTEGAKLGVFYMGQIASGATDNSVQGRFSVAF
jgi:outer membrane autotransporter protein